MKYIYTKDNLVLDIILEVDPAFPEVPKEQRFTAEFLEQLIAVEDAVEVEPLWIYDSEAGVFSDPSTEVI